MARYWLAFDLGFGADYDELFEWLDEKDAKECTPNVATFTTSKSVKTIQEELSDVLSDNKKARLYIVFNKQGETAGRWIVGKRKAAPWAGFFIPESEQEEDED